MSNDKHAVSGSLFGNMSAINIGTRPRPPRTGSLNKVLNELSAIGQEIEAEVISMNDTLDVTEDIGDEDIPGPVTDMTGKWDFVPFRSPTGNSLGVRINDSDLRDFIYFESSCEFIPSDHLEDEKDTARMKNIRARKSVYLLDAVVSDVTSEPDYGPECFSKEDVALPREVWVAFKEAVVTAHAKALQESYDAFDSDCFNFKQLTQSLNRQGILLAYIHDKDYFVIKSSRASIQKGMMGNIFVHVSGTCFGYDGHRIGMEEKSFDVPEFAGTACLEDLGIMLVDKGDLRERLITRGRTFMSLIQKPEYKQYKGVITLKQGQRIHKANATGRVIIDMAGMKEFRPNYYQYYAGHNTYHTAHSAPTDMKDISDETFMMLPPVVYGFSFNAKLWGEMDVSSFTEIEFRKDAFEMLQMHAPTKKLLCALIENLGDNDKDFIAGKGGGCIVLATGNPGVGKTLTAETMAERLQRPLYMVNVGELGVTADDLEENLKTILDVATSWNAILLIDEADIFLEERSDLDIHRNAMVAVFLRLLEYYQGILFMTTNRAAKIDRAFFSRIHLALHYDDLDDADRSKIWTNLLARNDIKNINVPLLASKDLNGRQIKNSIANAASLAKYEKSPVKDSHFQVVIDKIDEFAKVLKASKNKGFFSKLWNLLSGK